MEGDQVPRPDITICINPPNDNKDQGALSGNSVEWTTEQYDHLLNQPSLFQGYPQPSLPQDIPRGNTVGYESPLGSPSVPGIWDTRSPASSDSGWSNASSPLVGQFGEEFHDDTTDFLLDNRSYVSDSQYQADFDLENFLSLASPTTELVQSPDTTSPTGYLSGPDPYQMNDSLSSANHFATQYIPPYNHGQVSPTYSPSFPHSFPNMGNNSNDVPPMKLAHHRSSSDFLSVPPSPTLYRNGRSPSRGPKGHRSTISEGSTGFLSPEVFNPEVLSPDTSIFLNDPRGRRLERTKSAPSAKATSNIRQKSPYARPASQTDIMPRLEIPTFIRPISGPSTPELESPSPSSAKEVVATDAMVTASNRRRKREANYFCPQCGATFTTENSRKRHESSHSGEKPYVCTKKGCGQTFSNDDDRKRHENKSKKHAAQ